MCRYCIVLIQTSPWLPQHLFSPTHADCWTPCSVASSSVGLYMKSGVEEKIPYSQFRAPLLDNSRIRQLADCQLADWTTRGLDISRTRQLVYWTSRGLDNSRMHLRVRELSRPRLVQSASWQSASWTSAQLWDRGTDRCSGETGFSTQPHIFLFPTLECFSVIKIMGLPCENMTYVLFYIAQNDKTSRCDKFSLFDSVT